MHELYLVLAVLAITGATALLAVRRRAPSCDACGDRAAATLCLRCLDGRRVRPEPLPMAPPPCCQAKFEAERERHAVVEADTTAQRDAIRAQCTRLTDERDRLRFEVQRLQQNALIRQGRSGERF